MPLRGGARRLLRLSPTVPAALLLLAAALAWLAADALVLRPIARRNREVAEQVRGLQREVAGLRARFESPTPISPGERELFAEIDARIAERFPPETRLPNALDAVARLARAKGIEIDLLRLEARPAAAGAAPALPVGRPLAPHRFALRLRLVHDYGAGVELLDALGTLPVLLAVRSLDMQRAGRRVATDLVLVGFRIEG